MVNGFCSACSLIRSSTTAGSASVEVSPSAPNSSSAILRRMRRMILPERVLGRPGANWIRSGEAIGPISLRTQATSSLRRSSRRLLARHQGDIGVDALALDVVRIADDGGLRHLRMRDQRRFHLRRAHAVAGDVDHVVDAAGDPVIAVRVAPAAVAGEVLVRDRSRSRSARSARGRRRPCASGRARNRRSRDCPRPRPRAPCPPHRPPPASRRRTAAWPSRA